jgi:hypothetical protein
VGLQILALPSGLVPQAHQAAITYQLIEYTETFSKIESLECEPIPSHDQRVLDTRVFG